MQANLKDLERRAYQSTFQDGLWDIYLGLVLIGFGSMPVIRNMVSQAASIITYVITLILAIMILIIGKQMLTVPRLGYVRFSEERRARITKARLLLGSSILIGAGVFGVVLGNLVGLQGLAMIIAAIVLIVFGGLAYLLDFHRLLIYAIFASLSLPLGVALENEGVLNDAPTVFILTGAIALLIGSFMLQRFINTYQLPPEENVHG